MTIGQRGIFFLNPAAYDLLGHPEEIEFLYDSDARTVGIRAAPPGGENSYPVRSNGGSSWLISGGAFARYYGIRIGVAGGAWRRSAKLQDGVLVVDLKEPPQVVTSNRSSAVADDQPTSSGASASSSA